LIPINGKSKAKPLKTWETTKTLVGTNQPALTSRLKIRKGPTLKPTGRKIKIRIRKSKDIIRKNESNMAERDEKEENKNHRNCQRAPDMFL
jgi:hypothetical protein